MPLKVPQRTRQEPWSAQQLQGVRNVADDWLAYTEQVSRGGGHWKGLEGRTNVLEQLSRHPLFVRATMLARGFRERPNSELAVRLLSALVEFNRKGVDAKGDNRYRVGQFQSLLSIIHGEINHPFVHRLLVQTARHPGRIAPRRVVFAIRDNRKPIFSSIHPDLIHPTIHLLSRLKREDRPLALELLLQATGPESVPALARALPFAVDGTFEMTGHTGDHAVIHSLYARAVNPKRHDISEDDPAVQSLRAYVNAFHTTPEGIMENPKVVQAAMAHAFRSGWRPPASQRFVNVYVQQLRDTVTRGRSKS